MDSKTIQKMLFIHNAIENGWTIQKKHNYYIFKKKHNNKIQYFDESYIDTFIKENSTLSLISKN